MFRFENSYYLLGLLLIPVMVMLFYLTLRWRKNAIKRLGDFKLLERMMPAYSVSRQWWKFLLSALALGSIVIALANPQMGSRLEKVKRQGVDVVIAVDLSSSMLAEDIQPNRLERAKTIVSSLLDVLKNDRVALVVFAGNAYLQMPLTIDYSAAKLFLRTMDPEIMPTQGTAIADAIALSRETFDQEAKKHKSLILITDGENHEEGAITEAESAKEEGVIIHTLGIGSESGARVPNFVNGRRQGFKKDQSGNVVNSRLEDSMLKEIADLTDGKYFRIIGAQNEVRKVVTEINSMDKKDFEDRVFTDYDDKFQYFLGLALLLLTVNFFLPETKKQ